LKNANRRILKKISLIILTVFLIILTAWIIGPLYFNHPIGKLFDFCSVIALFATALVSFLACRRLESESGLKWRQNPAARPFFISGAGFFFLGLDEALSIHENIDKLIHLVLRIKETPATDHIDDFIILLYGIVALFFIKNFITEFRKYPYMTGLIGVGLLMFFVVFFMDFLTNNIETLRAFLFKDMSYSALHYRKNIGSMIEESMEFLAQAFFLAAFAAAFLNIKTHRPGLK